MDEKPKKVFLKNVKKVHAAPHGGSWKVAYADFVTAMMAFFLLMWLLASPEKKASMAVYFKHFSLFDKKGESFMMEGPPRLVKGDSTGTERDDAGGSGAGLTAEEVKGILLSAVNQKLQEEKSHILIEMTKQGVRVQIIDTESGSIFPAGSAQLGDRGKRILKVVAETGRGLSSKIVIEGHTDSSPTKGDVTNWELSAARACAARKEMEMDGVAATRISRVIGRADRAPLIQDNPLDPRNRRLSILFVFDKSGKATGGQKNIYDLLDPRD
jgi:chemotaxis protein MotB